MVSVNVTDDRVDCSRKLPDRSPSIAWNVVVADVPRGAVFIGGTTNNNKATRYGPNRRSCVTSSKRKVSTLNPGGSVPLVVVIYVRAVNIFAKLASENEVPLGPSFILSCDL